MLGKFTFLSLFFCLAADNLAAQSDRAALLAEYHRLDSLSDDLIETNPALLVEMSKAELAIGQQLQVDSLILNASLMLGQGLDVMGLFESALEVYYEAFSLAESAHDCYYLVKTSSQIGNVYQVLGNLEKSMEFLLKGKQYALACGLYSDTIHLNYDIGFIYGQKGDADRGIRMMEQNLEAAKKLGDKDYIIFGIDNLSNLLLESGDYDKSLEYELQLMQMPEVLDDPVTRAQVLEHLAEIYTEKKDWKNAQYYQREALKYAEQLQLKDWIFECYKLQSLIDEGNGNYKSALDNHRTYLALKDSVFQLEYEGKMAAMSSLYDLESKQKTISLLEKDREIKAGQIRTHRVLLLAGLLLLLLVVLVIRYLNHRKTQKMREAYAQDLLRVQEQERQQISKELHDSVGQNILFIKNRLQRLNPAPDNNLIQSVDQALEEVRTIAKGLYPNQLEAYGLNSAVDALCELAQESSGVFISSDLQNLEGRLNKDAQINCYRIIQECLNNALKHAEATAIRVSSNARADKVELVVQDNGKGFDKNILERKSVRSFGLINMEERIKMLRGKLELETSVNKGAKLTFSIPV